MTGIAILTVMRLRRRARRPACIRCEYVYTLNRIAREVTRRAMPEDDEPALPERIWRNARLATLSPERPDIGIIERGAIVARGGRIVFVGPEDELTAASRAGPGVVDCEGRWITPALVDCHTHLVYGG